VFRRSFCRRGKLVLKNRVDDGVCLTSGGFCIYQSAADFSFGSGDENWELLNDFRFRICSVLIWFFSASLSTPSAVFSRRRERAFSVTPSGYLGSFPLLLFCSLVLQLSHAPPTVRILLSPNVNLQNSSFHSPPLFRSKRSARRRCLRFPCPPCLLPLSDCALKVEARVLLSG